MRIHCEFCIEFDYSPCSKSTTRNDEFVLVDVFRRFSFTFQAADLQGNAIFTLQTKIETVAAVGRAKYDAVLGPNNSDYDSEID